jgi:hypothetical protein
MNLNAKTAGCSMRLGRSNQLYLLLDKQRQVISTLIFSNTYQNLKLANRNQKHKKNNHVPATSHQEEEIKKEKPQEIDFIKYLPKKTYNSSPE